MYATLLKYLRQLKVPRFSTDANGNTTGLLASDGTKYSLFGTRVFTVGAGGYFATLRDAFDYIASLTTLETLHTGSYTYADGARTLTASANISTATVGKRLFLKHTGDDLLYPIEVHNSGQTSAIMRPFYPLYGRSAGATDYSIVSPTTNYVVVLLPGRHSGDGAQLEVPPFTSVVGYGKNVSIFEDEVRLASAGIIEIPAASQDVMLRGFSVFNHGSLRGGSIVFTDENTSVITTGQRVLIEDVHTQSIGGSEDGFWKLSSTKNVIDQVTLRNCSGTGYYDIVALFNCRNVDITGGDFYSINTGAVEDEDLPQASSLSGNSLVDSYLTISTSRFRAYNASTGFSAGTIGCKIAATTAGTKNTIVRFDNNLVECEGLPESPAQGGALSSTTNGVYVEESGTAVGDLIVHSSNNTFNCFGATLNYAIFSGASGKVFTTNDRNIDGTAITTGTGAGGTATVTL